jgi:hypothetical protein
MNLTKEQLIKLASNTKIIYEWKNKYPLSVFGQEAVDTLTEILSIIYAEIGLDLVM